MEKDIRVCDDVQLSKDKMDSTNMYGCKQGNPLLLLSSFHDSEAEAKKKDLKDEGATLLWEWEDLSAMLQTDLVH